MIGHYLLSLIPEAEEHVLTRSFGPIYETQYLGVAADDFRCLVMRACDRATFTPECGRVEESARRREQPAFRYEKLCRRFGMLRINAAIRNHILANQARRVLGSARRALLERAK